MNIIKVKDYESMQAITVSLAKNGYLVTADSVTDDHYRDHWEIKYCELSEMTEKPNNTSSSDFDGDYLGSMTIHNEDNTEDDGFDDCLDDFDSKDVVVKDYTPPDDSEPQGFLTNQTDYGLIPRDKILDIPKFNPKDTSDNITDEQMTVITSVSGN